MGRIYEQSHLHLGFSLLWVFKLWIQFWKYRLSYLIFSISSGIILVRCAFQGTCPFTLSCWIYRHKIINVFVFLGDWIPFHYIITLFITGNISCLKSTLILIKLFQLSLWHIFFYAFIFKESMFLYLKWYFCRLHIVRSCFLSNLTIYVWFSVVYI